MQPMLNIALRAARSAGELIIRSIERLDVISVNEKDAHDYVSEVDRAAEQTIIQALQKADQDKVATPADWRPGQDVIIPTAGSCGTAKERMESKDDDKYCLDWFMCFKREKKA